MNRQCRAWKNRIFLMLCLAPCLMLSAGVWAQTGKRDKVEHLTFLLPDQWQRVPSVTGPGFALHSPTPHKVSSIAVADIIFVRAIPAGRLTLTDYKKIFRDTSHSQLAALVNDYKRQYTPAKSALKVDATRDFNIEIKDTKVGRIAACELDCRSVIMAQGQPVKNQSRQIAAIYKGKIYIITSSYEIDRQQQMKPIADAFLASLKWDEE